MSNTFTSNPETSPYTNSCNKDEGLYAERRRICDRPWVTGHVETRRNDTFIT